MAEAMKIKRIQEDYTWQDKAWIYMGNISLWFVFMHRKRFSIKTSSHNAREASSMIAVKKWKAADWAKELRKFLHAELILGTAKYLFAKCFIQAWFTY